MEETKCLKPPDSGHDRPFAVSAPLSGSKLLSEMAEKTARKQRGRPFQRGESGNPAGRPVGARHKATVAAEALLDGEAEALTRKAVEMALAGDTVALRLCLERILPPRRERLVRFKLPRLQSLADAATAMAAIIAAVATADLTLGEAAELAKLIGAFAKALEETAGGDSDLIEVWTDMGDGTVSGPRGKRLTREAFDHLNAGDRHGVIFIEGDDAKA
jgi:hypothetical protein